MARKQRGQKPALSMRELKRILEGVQYGSLSRDELEHACRIIGVPVCDNDSDEELGYYVRAELEKIQ